MGPVDDKLQRRRIIHRTHAGDNHVVNPSIKEVFSDPEMQTKLQMVGSPISEKGIADRAKALHDLYQIRRANLKYQRKRQIEV